MVAASASTDLVPPYFLRLAAHPVRWQMLRELAQSDRRVGELCDLLGRPQNLVSYHLGRLRGDGLVQRRRSTHDGRDSYYALDLTRCAESLAETGGALHPALSPASPSTAPARRASARVLFLCTGNSARSQMAEALAESLGGGGIKAFSAGSRPKPLHPHAVRVMRERGLDVSGRRSKQLSAFAGRRFDYVVTLCDRVREVCPEFPGHPELTHWSVPDPSAEGTYDAFERVAAEIAARTTFLIELIATHSRTRR